MKAGKIRAIGVSNFSVPQLEEWRATGVPLHSDQPPYSILRPAVKQDVLPWCAAHDVGAISYSPLFRGLLFGTWSKDKTFPADDGRSTHKDYAGVRFQRHLQAVEEIRAVAAASGLSVSAAVRRRAAPDARPDRRHRRRQERAAGRRDREPRRRRHRRTGGRGVGDRGEPREGPADSLEWPSAGHRPPTVCQHVACSRAPLSNTPRGSPRGPPLARR